MRWFAKISVLMVAAGMLMTPLATAAHEPDEAIIYTFPAADTVFPEGIALHPGNGDFFVGSTTNGAIYRGNARGESRAIAPFLAGGSDGRTTVVGMKVSPQGILYAAGGGTGTLWMYDAITGRLLSSFRNGVASTFVNDVALAPDGAAYFTDSLSPYIYRIKADSNGVYQYELWRDLQETVFQYVAGFNANGIVVTADGKYLIIVQSNTGKLFRIDIATKEVSEIPLAGRDLMTAGDGLLLDGQMLYVVRNQLNLIVKVRLNADFTGGQQVGSFTDPSFGFTTTATRSDDRLLVVNSQFNRRGPNLTPNFPFTVSSVQIP